MLHPNSDSSKNDMEKHKKEKQEMKLEPSSTVTFVENSGGLEKSKSDSKLNQVSSRNCMTSLCPYLCHLKIIE